MTRPDGLRLLAVTHTGQVSGAEKVLVQVLAAAVARGWRVACAAPAGPLTVELTAAGVRSVELPDLGLTAGPRILGATRMLLSWGRAAQRLWGTSRGADLVLANSLLALPALRAAQPDAPVVWLVHDVLVRADRRRLLRWCAPTITRAVAVSHAAAQPLRASGVHTQVVTNGVRWPVAAARNDVSGGPPVIGINALLTPWKGHRVVLDAVPLLRRPAVFEVMGGHLPKDSAYAAEIAARATAPVMRQRVRLLGHVEDPLVRMRSWTVAVNASIDPEAAPLAVLEAMSLGVPVVATAHGGSPEVLGGAGLLVPPGDPVALAAAVDRLLDDRQLRERCARAGRRTVASSHRLAAQTGELLDVLEQVAREEARRG